ncbi:MAG: response regulator [Planctomycetota bacterium]
MFVPRLLITDDDAAYRAVLTDALTRRGMEVAEAGDGDEALAMLDVETFHMVLVDVHMPKVTGLEVIRELATRPEPPPYVLMSAQLDELIEREAARMRAYRVLSKPLRLRQLDDVVRGGLAEVYGWTG